jgi:diguanylate cyclase (GGDEF)-like protein/PAS domain S-box-containing protein
MTAIVMRALHAARIRTAPDSRDLQTIIDRSPDALMRFGLDLRCTFASPAAGRLFGRPARALVGQPLGGALSGDDRALVEAAARSAGEGWLSAEAVFRASTGSGDALWVEARLARASEDGSLVAVLRDVSARKTAELALRVANAELNKLAGSDGLTALANRRRFDQMLDSACRRGSRQGSPVSLLLIDLDGFEGFNNRYGHQAGDACLKRVAAAIRAALPGPSDLAARFAGEEFAVMLPGRDSATAHAFAERVRETLMALAIPHDANPEGGGVVTATIGCATAEPARDTPQASGTLLIAEADRALYESKRSGRNRVGAVVCFAAGSTQSRAAAA